MCDFGLARHVSSVSSLTGDRGFVGTIDYVPPEQIQGGAVDGRTDVYSLGCVLFECLAGARPFERESELSVIFAHLNEPPPRALGAQARVAGGVRRGRRHRAREGARGPVPDLRRAGMGRPGSAAGAAARPPEEAAAEVAHAPRSRWPRPRRSPAPSCIREAAVRGRRRRRPRPVQITENAIAGATTGRTAAFYEKRFGGYRFSALAKEPFYRFLSFQQLSVDVYFPAKGKRAIIIATWNRDYRTARGIGPCSTIAEMKRAYGSAVQPSWSGSLPDGTKHSYVVGDNLLFATQDLRTISAVALYRGVHGHTREFSPQSFANYIAANETACR